MPERRAEPPEDDHSRIAGPPLRTCSCGKPAWVFPQVGFRFCGFCPASAADRAERQALLDEMVDVDDAREARADRIAGLL